MGNDRSPRTVKDEPLPPVFPTNRTTPTSARPVDPDDGSRRQVRHEQPGVVDFPWDDDWQSGGASNRHPDILRSDATCAMAWRTDGFEAIQVFVDPALRDRAVELCAAIEGWSGVHRRLDDLSEEIQGYAEHEGLSVTIERRPRDDLSTGLVAIAITVG